MVERTEEDGTLPLLTPGGRLREARLAAGLELDEIAARTRIAKRHLIALEEDRYGDLASRTYAIGFSRNYARVMGLDEASITQAVRDELDRQERLNPRPQRSENFEPGDPARIPSSSLARIAAIGVALVLVGLFVFWRSFLAPAADFPDENSKPQPVASARPASPASAGKALDPVGAVTLTALENGVWVKIDDAAGQQIYQKEMALGESFRVPANASGAVLATARPDALRVTVGSRVLEKLRDQPETLRDLPLAPASLLAPRQAVPAPDASGTAVQTSTVSDRP